MDAKGVAVRTGHHCTQPLMDRFSIEGTTRASFSVYNTIAEIDIFVEALKDIIKKLKP
jgi:cysteine desulfurase/selenocysteine lyase